MTSTIYEEVKHSTSLKHVQVGLIKAIKIINKSNSSKRIGFVSGIITSDGDENMRKNIERLGHYTKRIRESSVFPIFSAVDVFENGIYDRIEEIKLERELREYHFVNFWKIILESGHITDIYMTPRWKTSRGAKEEYGIAKELGIKIHFVE